LHNNVDRLFAMWQTQPGHPERLDPQQVYAAYSSTQCSGDVNTLHPNWGILSPLEPWAETGIETNASALLGAKWKQPLGCIGSGDGWTRVGMSGRVALTRAERE
jgi:hypothetical protein